MRFRRLEDQRRGAFRLAVSGLGAFRILAHEQGLHVFETPKSESRFARQTVQVIVAPWRQKDDRRPLDDQADEALRGVDRNRSIVRRYREEPSPLVRDSRGWRTGRLDTVLAGNFDVFS
jgi:ATP-dependent Clp protease ATP-binding subunit ClpC